MELDAGAAEEDVEHGPAIVCSAAEERPKPEPGLRAVVPDTGRAAVMGSW